MRTMSLAVVGLLLLAGCSDDPAPDCEDCDAPGDDPGGQDPTSDPGGSSSSTTTTSTGAPANASNEPPVANIVASVSTGQAPLRTNFTLEAIDPEEDSLAWSFDADADGTPDAEGDDLPAKVNFTFEAPGNYTATLNVSDGTNDVQATQAIEVLTTPAVPSQYLEGGIDGRSPGCVPNVPYDQSGEGFVEVGADAATVGHPFFLRFRSGSAQDLFLILDAAGEELLRMDLGASEAELPNNNGVWHGSGMVPAGAATLVFAACDQVLGELNNEDYKYDAGPQAQAPEF